MKSGKLILLLSVVVAFLSGCGDEEASKKQETTTSGFINISVDESFKPVIDSQIQVFESLHPDAHINVNYKPEAECLKDLDNDSIRMVIVTRGLSEDEQKRFNKKLNYHPRFGVIAYDAIAVLVNNSSKDTMFTMQDIRSIANGTSGFKYKMLLDGTTATSTVKYVIDSLLRGKPITPDVSK